MFYISWGDLRRIWKEPWGVELLLLVAVLIQVVSCLEAVLWDICLRSNLQALTPSPHHDWAGSPGWSESQGAESRLLNCLTLPEGWRSIFQASPRPLGATTGSRNFSKAYVLSRILHKISYTRLRSVRSRTKHVFFSPALAQKAAAMPGVQPVTIESRAGIQSRGLGYEPSWSSSLAPWSNKGAGW